LRADADFFENWGDNAFFVFDQGGEQVGGLQLGITVLGS